MPAAADVCEPRVMLSGAAPPQDGADTKAAAPVLPPGGYTSDLTDQETRDIYRLELTNPLTRVFVRVGGAGEDVSFTVQRRDADDAAWEQAGHLGADVPAGRQRGRVLDLPAGTYYLEVHLQPKPLTTPYDLVFAATPVNGTAPGETRADAGTLTAGTRYGYLAPGQSEHVYRVTIGETRRISVNLTDLDADLDVQFLHSDGTRVGSTTSNHPGTRNEFSSRELPAGTYFVRVSEDSPGSAGKYTLRATTAGPSSQVAGPVRLEAGNLRQVGGEMLHLSETLDYWWFSVSGSEAGRPFGIAMNPLHEDLHFRLEDDVPAGGAAWSVLDVSENAGLAAESIYFDALAAGTYYVRVYGHHHTAESEYLFETGFGADALSAANAYGDAWTPGSGGDNTGGGNTGDGGGDDGGGSDPDPWVNPWTPPDRYASQWAYNEAGEQFDLTLTRDEYLFASEGMPLGGWPADVEIAVTSRSDWADVPPTATDVGRSVSISEAHFGRIEADADHYDTTGETRYELAHGRTLDTQHAFTLEDDGTLLLHRGGFDSERFDWLELVVTSNTVCTVTEERDGDDGTFAGDDDCPEPEVERVRVMLDDLNEDPYFIYAVGSGDASVDSHIFVEVSGSDTDDDDLWRVYEPLSNLSLSATGLPEGAVFNREGFNEYRLEGPLDLAALGTYDVAVLITDEGGRSAESDLSLNVVSSRDEVRTAVARRAVAPIRGFPTTCDPVATARALRILVETAKTWEAENEPVAARLLWNFLSRYPVPEGQPTGGEDVMSVFEPHLERPVRDAVVRRFIKLHEDTGGVLFNQGDFEAHIADYPHVPSSIDTNWYPWWVDRDNDHTDEMYHAFGGMRIVVSLNDSVRIERIGRRTYTHPNGRHISYPLYRVQIAATLTLNDRYIFRRNAKAEVFESYRAGVYLQQVCGYGRFDVAGTREVNVVYNFADVPEFIRTRGSADFLDD